MSPLGNIGVPLTDFEPARMAGRQQPQDQAAEDGQQRGRVAGERDAKVPVAGDGPGTDDADQRYR